MYRLLAENLTDAITVWNAEGHALYTNPAAERSLGFSRDELSAINKWDQIHGEDLPAMQEAFEQALQGKPSRQFDVRWGMKDGSWRYGDIVIAPYRVPGYGPLVLTVSRDVTRRKQAEEVLENHRDQLEDLVKERTSELTRTVARLLQEAKERRQAEEALGQSEAFLNSIIDQNPCPMWISDENGTLIRLNQACCELLNITEDEVVGKYNVLQDSIVEGQGLLPLVEAVFREGRAVRFELEYDTSRLEGLTFQRTASVILDVTIFPIRDAAGRITNAVIQHIDITERKQAEEALRESEERFSKVFHSSALGIAISSMRDGRIIDVNDTLLEALGRSRQEVVGRSAAEHGIWADNTDREKMVQALQAGATIRRS